MIYRAVMCMLWDWIINFTEAAEIEVLIHRLGMHWLT